MCQWVWSLTQRVGVAYGSGRGLRREVDLMEGLGISEIFLSLLAHQLSPPPTLLSCNHTNTRHSKRQHKSRKGYSDMYAATKFCSVTLSFLQYSALKHFDHVAVM